MEGSLADSSVAVVTPMANEGSTAVALVTEILTLLDDFGDVRYFVVLDGASTDGTRRLLEDYAQIDPRCHVVWAPESRSVFDAYMRGYREALASGCEWIVEIDGGFSHRPEDLHFFLEKMSQGFDCIFGTRFALGGRMDAPVGRRLVSRGGTLLTNLLLGTRLTDLTSGYQVFRSTCLEAILERGIRPSTHFFQTEMKVYSSRFRVAEVPIQYAEPSMSVGGRTVVSALVSLVRLFVKRLGRRLR